MNSPLSPCCVTSAVGQASQRPHVQRGCISPVKEYAESSGPTDPSASVQVASALCRRLCRFRLVGALNSEGAVRAPAPPFLGGRGCAQEKQEALFSQTRGPALCQAAGEGGGGCLGMARSAPRPGTQAGFRECSRLPSLQQNLQPLWPPHPAPPRALTRLKWGCADRACANFQGLSTDPSDGGALPLLFRTALVLLWPECRGPLARRRRPLDAEKSTSLPLATLFTL